MAFAAVALLVVSVLQPRTAAAADCDFKLGFLALRDQIPEIVGECLEQEQLNLINGNTEQRTTGGMLVWRKADNLTTFTDGTTTWIAGPNGLVSRPNDGQRFTWEAAADPAPTPIAIRTPNPSPSPAPAPVLAPAPPPAQQPAPAPRLGPAPMPIISRGLPAHAENGNSANQANDQDYATQWRSGELPAWIAYDLASVPANQRGGVLLAWYGNETSHYDTSLTPGRARHIPASYTVEAHAAPGGGKAPADGWKTLLTVSDNVYHSWQHLLDLSGYNWVRFRVTEAVGASPLEEVRLNLDLHSVGDGPQDAWIFYGDSITVGAMGLVPDESTGTFAQLVNARVPTHFPSQQGGGIGGLRSADGARLIDKWLSRFPGRYVGLSYGTNDARVPVRPDEFYANYATMIRAVIAAGKIPLVPKIPWARADFVQEHAPRLNDVIEKLYDDFPAVVQGPDFWAFFQENQHLISRDDVHPSPAGYAAYRQQWAEAMVRRVYAQ